MVLGRFCTTFLGATETKKKEFHNNDTKRTTKKITCFFFLTFFKFNLSLLLLRDVRLEDLGSSSLLVSKVGSNFVMFGNTLLVGDEEGVALSVDPFLGEERNEINKKAK